jgi:hypothetical protein
MDGGPTKAIDDSAKLAQFALSRPIEEQRGCRFPESSHSFSNCGELRPFHTNVRDTPPTGSLEALTRLLERGKLPVQGNH